MSSAASLLALQLAPKRKKLGELLVEQKLLGEEELQTALIFQKAQPGKMLGAILLELGYVSQLDLMEALTSTLRIQKPYTPL